MNLIFNILKTFNGEKCYPFKGISLTKKKSWNQSMNLKNEKILMNRNGYISCLKSEKIILKQSENNNNKYIALLYL